MTELKELVKRETCKIVYEDAVPNDFNFFGKTFPSSNLSDWVEQTNNHKQPNLIPNIKTTSVRHRDKVVIEFQRNMCFSTEQITNIS